jgi:hypothetical protein
VDGTVRLSDGTTASMKECIKEFASSSKSREGNKIKKQSRERIDELKAVALVDKY